MQAHEMLQQKIWAVVGANVIRTSMAIRSTKNLRTGVMRSIQ